MNSQREAEMVRRLNKLRPCTLEPQSTGTSNDTIDVSVAKIDSRPPSLSASLMTSLAAVAHSTPQALEAEEPEETFDLLETLEEDHNDSDVGAMTSADASIRVASFALREFEDETEGVLDCKVEGFTQGIRLYPHQVLGRRWMAEREQDPKRGGILADESGLGKTFQVLARILDGPPSPSEAQDRSNSTLIICPRSLVNQWEDETQRACGQGIAYIHDGREPNAGEEPPKLGSHKIVIAAYETVVREYRRLCGQDVGDASADSDAEEASDVRDSRAEEASDRRDSRAEEASDRRDSGAKGSSSTLLGMKWWRVILDEGHTIRNPDGRKNMACCELDAKYRWVVTSTPVGNDITDLRGIFSFLRTRPLGDTDAFRHLFVAPIEARRPVVAIQRLQVVLHAIMLRRLKSSRQVSTALPDRFVEDISCTFSNEERSLYDSIAKTAKKPVLFTFLRLRQACLHPTLAARKWDETAGQGKLCTLCNAAPALVKSDHCAECQRTGLAISERVAKPEAPTPFMSAKMAAALNLLKMYAESGDKTIIFSESTTALDILQKFLEVQQVPFVCYYGRYLGGDKIRQIQDTDTRVLLTTWRAAGVGLNLHTFNRVIALDIPWNPSVEDLAFARVHRFGQTKPVTIYRLILQQTVEQHVLKLQGEKRAFAASALDGNTDELTPDDLMELFRHLECSFDSEEY